MLITACRARGGRLTRLGLRPLLLGLALLLLLGLQLSRLLLAGPLPAVDATRRSPYDEIQQVAPWLVGVVPSNVSEPSGARE